LTATERRRVDARVDELMAEVHGLRGLRKVANRSQVQMARQLRLTQPAISKIERQRDVFLSTLNRYVRATGGELEIVVKFPRIGRVKVKDLPRRRAL